MVNPFGGRGSAPDHTGSYTAPHIMTSGAGCRLPPQQLHSTSGLEKPLVFRRSF